MDGRFLQSVMILQGTCKFAKILCKFAGLQTLHCKLCIRD